MPTSSHNRIAELHNLAAHAHPPLPRRMAKAITLLRMSCPGKPMSTRQTRLNSAKNLRRKRTIPEKE